MMTFTFNIKCILCGNSNDKLFYVMPKKEKTKSGDIIRSTSTYEIVCKKCGKEYKFTTTLTG